MSTAKNREHDGGHRHGEQHDERLGPVSDAQPVAGDAEQQEDISEHALPTDAIADRSTKLATTSTRTAVTSSPPCWPSRDARPKIGGNCRISASIVRQAADAKRVPFVDDGGRDERGDRPSA